MFGRRKRTGASGGSGASGASAGLRAAALALDPGEYGMSPTERHPNVFGGMLETTLDAGSFTLLCVAEGTTSLYFGNGGGIVGAGTHPRVAAASLAFLDALEAHLAGLAPDTDDALPPPGGAVLRALTFGGRRGVRAAEDDLGEGRHPLSPVFHAAHAVLTEVRLAEGAR